MTSPLGKVIVQIARVQSTSAWSHLEDILHEARGEIKGCTAMTRINKSHTLIYLNSYGAPHAGGSFSYLGSPQTRAHSPEASWSPAGRWRLWVLEL